MCYIYLFNLKINVVLIKLENCRKNLLLRICALNKEIIGQKQLAFSSVNINAKSIMFNEID